MASGSSRRGGVLSAVLIGLAVLLMLAGAAAIGAGVYLARSITVRESHNQTVVETPFGTLRVREAPPFNPAHLGLPVYPGAVREDDDRKLASFELDFGETQKEFSIQAAHYTTTDPFGRVTDYYRTQLPHWTYKKTRRNAAHFRFEDGGHTRVVAIREHHRVTHIGLASLGEPGSN